MKITKTLQHALKTGLAVGITWIVCNWLKYYDSHRPIWALISTVLVMQSNLGSVIRASGVRIGGTLIGAVIGAIVGSLVDANALSLALSVALTMGVLSGIGLPETLRLAGTTAIVVLVSKQVEEGPWLTAFFRFVEVFIGISVAILVQTIIWPSRARNELRDAALGVVLGVRQLYPIISTLSHAPVTAEESVQRDGMRAELLSASAKLREIYGDLQREPGDHRQEILIWGAHLRFCDELELHALALEHSQRWLRGVTLGDQLAEPLQSLTTLTQQCLDRLVARLEGQEVAVPATGLDAALAGCDAAMVRLREQGITLSYAMPDVIRFCTYFFNLRAISRHASGLEFAFALPTKK